MDKQTAESLLSMLKLALALAEQENQVFLSQKIREAIAVIDVTRLH